MLVFWKGSHASAIGNFGEHLVIEYTENHLFEWMQQASLQSGKTLPK